MKPFSTSRVTRKAATALAASLLLLGTAACGSDSEGSSSTTAPAGGGSSTPAADGAVTAGFIFVGPLNDGGWTQAHNEGRLQAEEILGDKATTLVKESVPEGPETIAVAEDMIKDGAKIIFAASFGYGDALKELATKYPDVKFEHATGLESGGNLATYFAASEDTIYLTGIAAGKAASEGGKIGFVAPFAIPEVIRHINAFELGVQSVNPTATTKVVWTNTWFDPTAERQAADSLIADGVEVIASGQDSPASGEAAKDNKLPFVGYDSDQSQNLADIWLTASLYHWGEYYAERIQAVIDGTWETHDWYGGLNDGVISLAPFGDLVDEETRTLIEETQAKLASGEFYEFTGPLVDQDGEERVPAGEKMTLDEILAMDWFVKGVEGSAKG